MAKKVVTTLKSASKKKLAKIIQPIRSPRTGAYTFKEKMIPAEEVLTLLTPPK